MEAGASLYNAVENQSIIKVIVRQVHEAVHRNWSVLWIKLQHNQATVRVDTYTIEFIDINTHSWSVRVSMLNFRDFRRGGSDRLVGQLIDDV